MEKKVLLNDVPNLYEFCALASKKGFKIDALNETGYYRLNAKSFMGLNSLDLSKPITIAVSEHEKRENEAEVKKFFDEIEKYAVK